MDFISVHFSCVNVCVKSRCHTSLWSLLILFINKVNWLHKCITVNWIKKKLNVIDFNVIESWQRKPK